MDKILVVDIGTTNLKAGIVNEIGKVFSYAEEGIKFYRPEKGAVEHNPEELYSTFKRVCRKAASGFEDDISLIVLSTYLCGFLPVDKHIKPLCGIATILDTRCKNAAEYLNEKYDVQRIYRRTGCPPSFIYALPKIFWLKEKKPKVFSKTRYFLSSKDYIIYRLTGEICTEPSLASATQMFNIHSLDWDDYVLDIAGINRKNLPPV
ncbi:carbohydrate kinase, partial [Candidatus Desantisbacteria bacterium CG07_land_8_20_14_0_80_39_15]